MSPKKIRELRVRAGLSQTELADKIHVSQMTVSNWETKKIIPNKDQEAALKKVLGLGAEEDESPNASPIAAWVNKVRVSKGLSVPELAERSGLTPPAIYRIESGGTRNLRSSTRQKLEKALGKMPEDAAEEAAEDAAISGLGSLEDFDPHSDEERPSELPRDAAERAQKAPPGRGARGTATWVAMAGGSDQRVPSVSRRASAPRSSQVAWVWKVQTGWAA